MHNAIRKSGERSMCVDSESNLSYWLSVFRCRARVSGGVSGGIGQVCSSEARMTLFLHGGGSVSGSEVCSVLSKFVCAV